MTRAHQKGRTAMSQREIPVQVMLHPEELARLDEIKPSSMTRPAYLRSLLRGPPKGLDVASHEESLAILTDQARGGSATASVALEKALREAGWGRAKKKTPEDELEAIRS
jgi:hypothetical protein